MSEQIREISKNKNIFESLDKVDAFLNSIPMLWASGLSLLISFVGEYIVPFFNDGIHNDKMVNFAWVSILISGIPLAYLAIKRIVQESSISSALLITIAMIAAIYIDDIFAAGEIAFIMAIGAYLEDRTIEKTKQDIEKFLNLAPTKGRKIVVCPNGNVEEIMLDARDIKVDDVLRVLPGESFPSDGIVIEGTTTVDQSIMTGESLPVDKIKNDEIFTGTINCFGTVDIKVTKTFANSSLQKMIRLVEEAEENKAPTQKIVDKWSSWFVPIACMIAIATYCVMKFVFNQPEDALIRAVTVLVVFCPCALALATPTSIMAAVGNAAKNGILIKSGEALENMGNVSVVAFDKTGTITTGKLVVSDIKTFNIDKQKLIELAYAIESRSEHPLGKAIVNYSKENNINLLNLLNFKMIVGKGIYGDVDNKTIFCGNEKLITDNAKLEITKDIEEYIKTLRQEGKAIIIVADNKTILGVIGMADKIKDTSEFAISKLKSIGINKTVLLTGDNEYSAKFIAKKVGIEDIYASLLPEDKVYAIKNIMNTDEICMIGDGVNDAPALKTASVGIAMGTMGSDIAIEAADIAIMGDDISKISYIKKLSNATIFSIKFNIILAMGINFVAIILSVTGFLNPAMGALVHNAGSVLVVLNATRLYDKKIN